jgi:hypothetical protein
MQPRERLVELLRVQPREAEVVSALLRSAGIETVLGPDPIYESVSFTDGVPIFVAEADEEAARVFLGEGPGSAKSP